MNRRWGNSMVPSLGPLSSLGIAIGILVGVVVAWPWGSDAWAQRLRKVRIVAPSQTLSDLPIIVAHKVGFFKEEGYEIDYLVMKSNVGINALVAGNVDFTTSLGSTVRGAASGLPIKLVMCTVNKPNFVMVSRPEIKSVKELKGKVVGVSSFGGTGDYSARAVLEHYGLIPDREVTLVAIGESPVRLAALRAGSVDATILVAPFHVAAQKLGFTQLALVGDLLDLPLSGLGVTDSKIAEQPDQIRRVVRATMKGIRRIRSNREESVTIMQRWMQVDRDVAEGGYDIGLKTWQDDGIASEKALRRDIDLQATRLKKKTGEIPLSAVINWSFVKEVYRELER